MMFANSVRVRPPAVGATHASPSVLSGSPSPREERGRGVRTPSVVTKGWVEMKMLEKTTDGGQSIHPSPTHARRPRPPARTRLPLPRFLRRWRLRGGQSSPLPLYAFLGGVITLALVGVFLAVGMFGWFGIGSRGSGNHSGPFGLAQDVRTSFGVVTVESVDKSTGLTSQQLAGVNHGIQNLVSPDQVQVEVLVSITNQLDVPAAYSPGQFVLIADNSDKPISVTSASFYNGVLQPHAQIEGKLSFTVSLGAGKMLLRYTDPAQPQPILFDLGSTSGAQTTK